MTQPLKPVLIPFRKKVKATQTGLAGGEIDVLANYLQSDGVVFDVGAFHGDWTISAAGFSPRSTFHIFEADPATYRTTVANLRRAGIDSFVPNNLACQKSTGAVSFFRYEKHPSWNTSYRRESVEQELGIAPPIRMEVPAVTIDAYCQNHGIERIHYLKIDAEGAENDILRGARRMLSECRVDMLQFEYGGTFLDAGRELKESFRILQERGYDLYKISEQGLIFCPEFAPELENYAWCNYFVAHSRLRGLIQGLAPAMIDLRKALRERHITPKGVVHVGAHLGSEVPSYLEMGFGRILLIEANPSLAEQLVAKFGHIPEIVVAHCAASDTTGTLELNVTSGDGQSSSILPLGMHSRIYPNIVVESKVRVPTDTLDNILRSKSMDPRDFNFLNIDIQGAELLALKGAKGLLPHIEAINTEVNFAELYEGCALYYDIDRHLSAEGFTIAELTTPYHETWGDGLFVRKPTISMSNFGQNGRFANQLFQYAFLKCYAHEHDLEIEIPPWPTGEAFFGIRTSGIRTPKPAMHEPLERLPDVQRKFDLRDPVLVGSDLDGYFQFHTSCYRPYRKLIRSTFALTPHLNAQLLRARNALVPEDSTLVSLHLRRGDYGNGYFFLAPSSWYLEWLGQTWKTLRNPILYIASDEPGLVLPDFGQYAPLHAGSFREILAESVPDNIVDFFAIVQSDVAAISNSTFGFMATMLNERASMFVRPHLPSRKLVGYDPWNSAPLLFDRIENHMLPADE